MSLRSLFACSTALLLTLGCNCDRPPPAEDGGGVDDGGVPLDGFRPVPDGGGPPTGLFTPPTVTECGALAPVTTGRCEVTAGDTSRLIQGDVLTPGEVFRGGGVLVGADGVISCVGCDCVDMAGAATQVRCPGVVVSPGLINAHDHITFGNTVPYDAESPSLFTDERYEHRHDWRTSQPSRPHTSVSSGGGRATTEEMIWLELRQLVSGTTSVFGSGGPDGLLRNLDSSSRSGLTGGPADYETFPLGDARAETLLTDSCDYSYCRACSTMGVAMEHAFVPHVAEGINAAARNEYLCMREGMRDLVQPASAFIHGVGLLPVDFGEMALDDVELFWSPRTNITLYGDTARVTEAAYAGVTIGLGTDWVRSGSMNMLREFACADSFNQDYLASFFPEDQIWLMGTRNNALGFNVEDQIGVLATGRAADIALFDASAGPRDYAAVLRATPDDVVLVMRGGSVLYGDADVVGALRMGCDMFAPGGAADVCGSAKRVCLQSVSMTLSDLESQANRREMQYPLFFCGEPIGEPSCLPARTAMTPADAMVNGSNYYTGMSSADDMDGDGISDAMDNCPLVFNPIRPLDNGAQADSDGDGMGDACDSAPVDASDLDGDGVANGDDNCPTMPNMDQSDRDMDMIGDVCDQCPDTAVAAGSQTVYAVRCGATTGTVTLSDLVVTGVASNGFYAQQVEGSTDYSGPDYSGIFVFTASAPTVARGDVINAMGTPSEFFDLTQLTDPVITPVASGMEPAPLAVATADIATGGSRAEALESVLVRVETVTVASIEGMEFAVDDMLRVGNQLFMLAPAPTVGQAFQFVQGPLGFRFMNTLIQPRDLGDIGFGALVLGPSDVLVPPSGTVELTVVLPSDAPVGGASVSIAITPAGILTGPAAIVVPEGMRSASATYTASAADMTGTVTASFGGEMDSSPVTVATAPSLFFSEYVEGTGNNKAMEIVNGGTGTADLSLCVLRRYTNGSASPSSMYTFSGALGAGSVYVVCNAGVDMSAMHCDDTSGTVNHNGDDAYDLFCAGMVVDTFGQIGTDPGDEWMGGGLGTRDYVLTRMCSVTAGDPIGGDAFDPSTEWMGGAWVDMATSLSGLGNRDECP